MARSVTIWKRMVLDHVSQAARCFIERTAAADTEFLGERDLHTGHVVSVPERPQERVGKSKVDNVHDRFFSQEVVDTEDRVLREHLLSDTI